MSIGKLIRELRKERGLTQVQLAEYSGVTFATINKLENEKGGVKLETVEKVLSTLGHELIAQRKSKHSQNEMDA